MFVLSCLLFVFDIGLLILVAMVVLGVAVVVLRSAPLWVDIEIDAFFRL